MHQEFDLSKLKWELTGWHPNYWRMSESMELGLRLLADAPAVPARVPGSVQGALFDAGILPDWRKQLNSRLCEWVENRHWMFQAKLSAEWTAQPGKKILRCDGLDYAGVILVNKEEAGQFTGTFVPRSFDLTPHLRDGENTLSIIFTDVPDFLGQIGYTSRITTWKERFNYVWDWVPRIVQVGIWDAVTLSIEDGPTIESLSAFTRYDIKSRSGEVEIKVSVRGEGAHQIEVALERDGRELLRQNVASKASIVVKVSSVDAWHPNGNGDQPLYNLRVKLLGGDGKTTLDEQTRTVGFRQIDWKPCEGAPADALPWICSINGVDTFLQGFNWVPIRPNFADVTDDDYRKRLTLYREMGVNVLRIWGGAVLEREIFYRLCDEMGILVWQEFPLSSSGIENWPPEDAKAIGEMKSIVESYIPRRQHHASLLLWCGGNELMGDPEGKKGGFGKPVDNTHPMMAMMQKVVAALDPTRRFLPTSSSGPRFYGSPDDFGKGLHHDVHGPWNHPGALDGWFDYWRRDDALFRSETGMPGASSAAILREFGGDLAWPGNKNNPYWIHCTSWWIQWDDYLASGNDANDLDAYVKWSQSRQATALAFAARACRQRFPRCGGFIGWMGHDTFPCAVNTSVIDHNGEPKPAAIALAEVFKEPIGSKK